MRLNSETPLLQGFMSHANEGFPDLTVQLGDHCGSSQDGPAAADSYYDSCNPLRGYATAADGVSIYYEIHGLEPGGTLEQAHGRPKVVMIMGLACGCSAWRWQLQDLVQHHHLTPDYVGPSSQQQQQQQQQQKSGEQAQQQWQKQHSLLRQQFGVASEQQQQQQMLVLLLDNRGMGRSSSPTAPAAYSTKAMAGDVLAVMDHLQWDQAHVLGFSMGGMIAQSLAVLAPTRLSSLTLLATSAGGWQILPHSLSGLRIALRMLTARTPEDAVDATLHMHFRRKTLKAWVSHLAARRQELLRREYLGPSGCPAQPPHGFKGQLRACWSHRLTQKDADVINRAGFPVLVIHGRSDKLAAASNAEALARKLAAPLVILPGAHFIVRECAGQINMLLSCLVLGQEHITAVTNGRYMDPSPLLQLTWRTVDGPPGDLLQQQQQQPNHMAVAVAADVTGAQSSSKQHRT